MPTTTEPTDEELLEKWNRLKALPEVRALDRAFAPLADVATSLADDLGLLATSQGPQPETWEPECVSCRTGLGYVTKRNTYCAGRTECDACRGESLQERLRASGISFREIDQPLSALRNHDPAGVPYGAEYDRWLDYLGRFAALIPGQRVDPPFAFAYGSNGVGKSAGAERALRDAIRNGCAGRVVKFRDLVRKIMSAYGSGSRDPDERADGIVRTYAGLHLLVIQEVGMEDPTEHNYGLFFDFVDARWSAMLPTIFTSNYGPEESSLGAKMTERSHDETKMRAILDRIRGGVRENVFFLRGKSWRGHEAQR